MVGTSGEAYLRRKIVVEVFACEVETDTVLDPAFQVGTYYQHNIVLVAVSMLHKDLQLALVHADDKNDRPWMVQLDFLPKTWMNGAPNWYHPLGLDCQASSSVNYLLLKMGFCWVEDLEEMNYV